MQSFVWFVSACKIWTGAILWALENEPEQIMVCCTGWKEDREDLSCSEGPRETQLQVTLCNQRQRQGSCHLDSYTIHTFACPSVPPNPLHTPPHRHYTTPTASANTVPLTKSSLLIWRNRYLEFCPGQIPPLGLGEAKTSQTVNALPALIRFLWTERRSMGEPSW